MKAGQSNEGLTRERWIMLAILIVGVALRLQHLTAPLADAHSWRQTQTAMIARNLYRDGFNLWSPRVDFYCTEFCSESGLLVLEFPIYNAIVAVLYKIFGIHDYLGRLVSITFSVSTAYLLYRFARRFYGEAVSLNAALFFTLSPINIFYGRTFMPEPLMLLAGTGALLYFHIWLEDERWSSFTLALSFAITAFLVKFSMLHLAFPMGYMAWDRYGRALLRQWRLYLFVAAFSVPSLVWFLHAANSPNLNMYWLVLRPELFRDGKLSMSQFLSVMLERLRTDVLTPVGLVLFLLGVLLCIRTKTDRVMYAWLFGVLVFVFVMGAGNYVHHYYQLPIVPVASIFVGNALAYLAGARPSGHLGLRKYFGIAVASVLLATVTVESLRIVQPWYGEEIQGLYRFAEIAKSKIPVGRLVAVSSSFWNFEPWDPRLIYAFDRKGWNVCPRDLLWKTDRLRFRGARYLAIYPTDGLDSHLLVHLGTRYRPLTIPNQSRGAIFDLASSEGGVRMQSLLQEGSKGDGTVAKECEG